MNAAGYAETQATGAEDSYHIHTVNEKLAVVVDGRQEADERHAGAHVLPDGSTFVHPHVLDLAI